MTGPKAAGGERRQRPGSALLSRVKTTLKFRRLRAPGGTEQYLVVNPGAESRAVPTACRGLAEFKRPDDAADG
jgi:hypothetical protein